MSIKTRNRTKIVARTAVAAAAVGIAATGLASPAQAQVSNYRIDVNDCGAPYTQVCKKVPTVGTYTKSGRILVEFTADQGHCSDIFAQIVFDGRVWGQARLSAGERDGSYLIRTYPGSHRVGVRAIGIRGGCNVGYLRSWGGNLRIETDRDTFNGIG
ncbi:hypothetical protein QSJ18_04380 [Gordonia sp. ABSL1-1]|uniref:hypothetical protein n=1 Tax=Gordonia sp. ABSL1-1 TaxID=3053923 RepID=UPI00257339B9|nr:hypothetical protein [Gordonia sp. ABSL1-1]MDL9935975.1 hypothetical protein [Gordonia sp. ABSL1-1]